MRRDRRQGRKACVMKKAQIRMAVALALAENGYSPAQYAWGKPGWLEVFDGVAKRALHLPAVHKFKVEHLIERLSVLRPIGPPRDAPMPIKLPAEIQTDLETWLKERAAVPEHAAA